MTNQNLPAKWNKKTPDFWNLALKTPIWQPWLEVKCPFTVADKDLCEWELPYLSKDPTGLALKKEHNYYYQCQTQMALCDREFCDFVVWGRKCMLTMRILRDRELWASIHRKASEFHDRVIWLELLAKYFTKSTLKTKKQRQEDC